MLRGTQEVLTERVQRWRSTHPWLRSSCHKWTGRRITWNLNWFLWVRVNKISNISWPPSMECVPAFQTLPLASSHCEHSFNFQLRFVSSRKLHSYCNNSPCVKTLSRYACFLTTSHNEGAATLYISVNSCWIPCNVTIAVRLLLFSLRPISNSCYDWLDDLLTQGIWWSSPAESHLIESPSNGNNFKPTSQIIRHFSQQTWFWNKLSSQQTHLYLTTVEVLQGDGEMKGRREGGEHKVTLLQPLFEKHRRSPLLEPMGITLLRSRSPPGHTYQNTWEAQRI